MLTLAFVTILSAHSRAELSPGMGISAVASFAISSALIDASRSFMTDKRIRDSESERDGDASSVAARGGYLLPAGAQSQCRA